MRLHGMITSSTLAFGLMLAFGASLFAEAIAPESNEEKAANQQAAQKYIEQRSFGFTENNGQITDLDGNTRPEIAFMTASKNTQLYFVPNGIYYTFGQALAQGDGNTADQHKVYRMDMQFVGANPYTTIAGSGVAPQTVRDYTNVAAGEIVTRRFERVDYKEMYPNVDISYYGDDRGMKYDVLVHPGGDINAVAMRYEGAESVELRADGSLLVTTPLGQIEEAAPYSYQLDDDGNQIEIESKYVIRDGQVGFEVGQYDPNKTLVVDPRVVWTTYYGGTGPPPPSTPGPDKNDYATSLTINSNGDLIICGWTESSWLPTTCCYGNHQIVNNGGKDAFVAAFTSGGGWLWSSYYGGTGDDEFNDVEMSNYFDRFHCVGTTESPSLFGAVNGPQGGKDVLMAWFSNDGQIVNSFFYGGSLDDKGHDLHVFQSGSVYATGSTNSTNFLNQNPAPTVPQNFLAGGTDAFVLSMNQAVTAVNWATYWGGPDNDAGHGIVMDGTHAYICGETGGSTYVPTVNGPGGLGALSGQCGFVAKFTSTASGTASWSYHFGGTGDDVATDLLLYTNIYLSGSPVQLAVTGQTESSSGLIVPLSGGSHAGGKDVFIARFMTNGGLSGPADAMLHGGSGNDYSNDITYWNTLPHGFSIVGYTESTDFPEIEAVQGAQGLKDVIVASFEAQNLQPVFSSYFGNVSDEKGEGIENLANGELYFTGGTYSVTLPGSAVAGVYQSGHNDLTTSPNHAAFYDAFLTRTERQSKFGTFLGGSNDDEIVDIVVDGDNNIIAVGWTESIDFVTTATAHQPHNGGGRDMFVSKFTSNGDLLWSTYLGGDDDDEATAVDIGAGNEIYITGFSVGNWVTGFPSTTTCATIYNLQQTEADGFLVKMSSTGALLHARSFGGQRDDRPQDIDVQSGKIYIVGYTNSIDFPVTGAPGTWGTQLNVNGWYNRRYDAFVAEFADVTTCGLTWARYYGGENEDQGFGVAVDGNGNVVLTGWTQSTPGVSPGEEFPIVNPGTLQATIGGGTDAFIARTNPTGTILQVSAYHGGSGDDWGRKVDTDASDRMIFIGETRSSNLPVVGTGIISNVQSNPGDQNLFLATVNGAGSVLNAASYYGIGTGNLAGNILVQSGEVFFTGRVSNNPLIGNFAGNLQANDFGTENAFVARTKHSLQNTDTWSSYYSDDATFNADFGMGLGVITDFWTNEVSLVLGGHNDNASSNFHTVWSHQETNAGLRDGFIGRIETTLDALRRNGSDLPEIVPVVTPEVASPLAVSLYPLPARDNLTLEVTYPDEGLADLRILSVDGATVLSTSIILNQAQELNLADLAQGVYYLRIQHQSASTMQLIVIHR